MRRLAVFALLAAVGGFLLGATLTWLLWVGRDPGWSWVLTLSAAGWVEALLLSAISLAVVIASSVWAWRVLLPEPRGGWFLPVALASWWLTWWLVPGNLIAATIGTADGAAPPADFVVWITALPFALMAWLITLLLWYGRRRDRARPTTDG